jgi:hypothetical protein
MLWVFGLALRALTVTDLTKDSYFRFTGEDIDIAVVHFYGRSCPACTAAEDTFEEISRMYWQIKSVKFGQLDCDRYTDVCDSSGAPGRPAWLVFIPGETHSKVYNRDISTDGFERWLRQQTGIWPHAMKDNLLYQNASTVELIRRKGGCLFAIVDQPRSPETQPLHNAARELEKTVKRGANFLAVDKSDNLPLASKLLKEEKFGAFLYQRGEWTPYTGKAEADAIQEFLNERKCGLQIATPSPTPDPLPELPDLPDNDFAPAGNDDDEEEVESPIDRARAFKERAKKEAEEEDQEEQIGDSGRAEEADDISEWSDDDDI